MPPWRHVRRRAGRARCRLRPSRARLAGGLAITRAGRSVSRQREFEIAPDQQYSRWYREPIAAGHAIAWNPSLPGGAKTEDTYLVADGGQLERMTSAPDWPAEPDDERQPPRPGVLEVGT